jgi:ABC transport system ATP-binding/permease protein
MPLIALDQVSVAFGHLPLPDDATLRIDRGEWVSVVGRAGTGKSTLLRIISGEQTPDGGSVWAEPGLRLARLDQDVPISTEHTVFEVVADALGDLSELVARYHHTSR